MGLRGPLPTHKLKHAERLEDLSPPDWLTEQGKAHWDRHAPNLSANQLLTTATADAFAMCCDLWAAYRSLSIEPTTKAYRDTVAAYKSLAKVFRLLPCDKPGSAPGDRHEDKPEFEM